MKVLVVGSGGREHAIVWKLAQSPLVDKIYAAPGNGGISEYAECVGIKATDIEGMVAFAKEKRIDLTVVAPDDPLAMGMVDALEAEGLKAFGPRKNAAIIESSKAFSKDLMKKYGIPTAAYENFDTYEDAAKYLESAQYPIVVKADGLALGKGVIIAQSKAEAMTALREIMLESKFGNAGARVVIEEFMVGPEVSILTFCDGKTAYPMVSVQDHKRAYDNDQGLNTGGMGTFSPSRVYTEELAQRVYDEIIMPSVKALNEEGRTFKGVIFFGLMLTENGPKLLEYNARFGDPETQVVLPRLKNDLMEIFLAIVDGTLDRIKLEWDERAAVCVVIAAGGYPEKYTTGYPITFDETLKKEKDLIIFHAGTRKTEEGFVTAGGRVLGVTALGADMDEARDKAYAAVKKIGFKDGRYRSDIGIKK